MFLDKAGRKQVVFLSEIQPYLGKRVKLWVETDDDYWFYTGTFETRFDKFGNSSSLRGEPGVNLRVEAPGERCFFTLVESDFANNRIYIVVQLV